MERTKTIRVLIERHEDWWIAQCLEYDLATQAKTLDLLHQEIVHLLTSHVDMCEELGIEPFRLPPAPQEFWAKFEAAKVATSLRSEPMALPALARQPVYETRIAA